MAIICEKHHLLKRSCYMCDYENEITKLREALELIKNNYPVPAETTDLIPIEVLYEIQLIVHKALEN